MTERIRRPTDDTVYRMLSEHHTTRTSGTITSFIMGSEGYPRPFADVQRDVVAALNRLRDRGMVEHKTGRCPGWKRVKIA